MENVYDYLKKLNIPYEKHDHIAVFTIAEAAAARIDAEFGENKNLFLRNRKGDKHYLVTLPGAKQLDLEKIATVLKEKQVSFASPERLQKYLGVTPGSVSPFGLINDVNKEVTFILDNDLLKFERLGFHPNINTQTLILATSDVKKYLEQIGNKVLFLDL